MYSIAKQWLRHSLLVVAATALVAGCADDSPTGPVPAPPTAPGPDIGSPAVDLGRCGNLGVPAGSTLVFHAYAQGVQNYRWDGGSWSLVGPSATLFADAEGRGVVGTHYTGPIWESASGGTVIGAVSERCTSNPDAIPWLLLVAVAHVGAGVFQEVTHIQRVHTVGGKAPSEAGVTDEVRGVPYTAEYFFYRAP